MIKMYNNHTNIEIEKKYQVKNQEVFAKVFKALSDWDAYEIKTGKIKEQVDTYFDNDDKVLLKSNRTLRIRHKNSNDFTLTIKVPTKNSSQEILNQNERFEHEIEINGNNLDDSGDFISKYITEYSDLDFEHQLHKTLIIVNQRQKHIVTKANIAFEMVFDDVNYTNEVTGKTDQEYQIEIEVKSDCLHGVNLKHLTDYIENKVAGLNPTTISKYEQGCRLTE